MSLNIIVAFAKHNFGIGANNSLPWNLPEDLNYFKKITHGSAVIMGRKTWESLPRRPLPGRCNIVITSGAKPDKMPENTVFTNMARIDEHISGANNVFVIGGAAIYKHFMTRANKIYATIINNKFDNCDTFFPTEEFQHFNILEYSEIINENGISYRHVVYTRTDVAHDEHKYLNLLTTVVNEGKMRPNRTGTDAISIFGHTMKFNITNTIPLLTTKFVPVRLIIEELLFFLRGDTDSKKLNAVGVKIWNVNTTREFLDSRGLNDYDVGLMGPMYGYNWRHFGAQYDPTGATPAAGFDQLNALIDGLINDPYSRRHLLTTYDPSTVSKCVLAPCHGIVTQFYVDDGFLHCSTYCRSSDTFLGLPFNIASYAILTQLIAKKCGYSAGDLTITTGDTHLYANHITPYETQIVRNPLPFPKLVISDAVVEKKWEDIVATDFDIVAYVHGPSILAEVSA